MSEIRSNGQISREIDLSGLNDDFIQSLVRDLKLVEKSAHIILRMDKKIPNEEQVATMSLLGWFKWSTS